MRGTQAELSSRTYFTRLLVKTFTVFVFDSSFSAMVCAQGEDYRVPTRNDQHDFREVQQGLSTLGFTDQEAAVSVSCNRSSLYVQLMCLLTGRCHIYAHVYASVFVCAYVHTYVSSDCDCVCVCEWVGGCVCSVPRGW